MIRLIFSERRGVLYFRLSHRSHSIEIRVASFTIRAVESLRVAEAVCILLDALLCYFSNDECSGAVRPFWDIKCGNGCGNVSALGVPRSGGSRPRGPFLGGCLA